MPEVWLSKPRRLQRRRWTSALSIVNCKIEPAWLDPGIFGRESPVDVRAFGVQRGVPRGDLLAERRRVRNPAIKTVLLEAIELDLCHVEPASMHWREVELEFVEETIACSNASSVGPPQRGNADDHSP